MAAPLATAQKGVVIGALLLTALNLLSAKQLGYPFLYCWLGDFATALYIATATVILYAVTAYIAYSLFTGAILKVLIGVLLFTTVTELPHLALMVFKAGGTCG